MKIVFVHHGAEYGGVEKHLIDLVERLDPVIFEPVILCFGAYGFDNAFSASRRKTIQIVTGLKRTRFYDYWKNFRGIRPDLVVFESGSVGDFPWYGHGAAKISRARRVLDFEHGMPPEIPHVRVRNLRSFLTRMLGWRARHEIARKLVWRISDKIVTVSNPLRRALRTDYNCPDQKTLTICNGVDVNYFSPFNRDTENLRARLGIHESECVLLAVARLTPHKRIGMIFEAMQALEQEGRKVRFLIAGAGPQEEDLRRRSSQMGLAGAVTFLGHQSDVRPCYAAADIFVLPSKNEGFPLSLIEAMASGLPSIATAAGGPSEMISNGSEGWLVNSLEQLTAAIRYALTHAAERKQMGLRARRKVVQQFSVESWTNKITTLLLSMAY